MNWMDSGDHTEVKQRQNKLENRKIEFNSVKVDYNISIAELLVLSAEKAGYEARIEKTNNSTNVEILIPYLVNSVGDSIKIEIYSWIYFVKFRVEIEASLNMEEEYNLLWYITGKNNSSLIKATTYCETDTWYIDFEKSSKRRTLLDKYIKRLKLLLRQRDAIIDDNDDIYYEMKSLLGKLDVYHDQNLDFNLSGGWNASEGWEQADIVDSINSLIDCVQEERENLLEFIKNR